MSIVARTLGFEAEYERNVDQLIASLHRDGWAQSNHLHSYHCGCGQCQLIPGVEWRFRAQHDATCAGEVITNILSLDEVALTAEALSTAAYDTDTEPGLNAGLHVHVGVPRHEIGTRLGMMLVFGLYEQALARLAAGPFRALRGMNRTVAQSLGGFSPYSPLPEAWSEQRIYARITELVGVHSEDRERAWERIWQSWERHANLSPAMNHPTMEVRIWNSTRAAWRIELFCRISHHLASPDVISALYIRANEWLPADDEPLDVDHQLEVLRAVLVTEDPTLDAHMLRQIAAHQTLAETDSPIQFTLS